MIEEFNQLLLQLVEFMTRRYLLQCKTRRGYLGYHLNNLLIYKPTY